MGLTSQLQPHRTATLHSLHIPPYTAETQPAQRPVASFWLWAVTEHTHILLLLPPHRPTLSAACVMDGARWAGAAGQHSLPTAHEHIAPHHHTIQHTCLSSAHTITHGIASCYAAQSVTDTSRPGPMQECVILFDIPSAPCDQGYATMSPLLCCPSDYSLR